MREMDLSVQNNMDSLEKRVKTFFSNAKKMKPQEKETEYELIRKDYYKTLEDADEKVHLANQMHDLVERYLRRLDQELHKFKMELEADNKGITEVLEKRSLELDQPQQNSSQKENRYNFSTTRTSHHEKRLAVEKPPVPIPEPRPLSASSGTIPAAPLPTTTTTNMQQGRRTASLKASYEAINTGVHAHEFSIGKELAGAAQTAIAAIQETTKKHKNSRKASSSTSATTATVATAATAITTLPPPVVPSPPPLQEPIDTNVGPDVAVDPNADNPDWTYDPNEPRYCICNQVSYGDMVACDNEDCPFEWFHYNCVDITAPPKGRWYCPQCTANMKRRGSRKN
ncbi:Inhibitor of growth protein 3 [Blattella germanica]|nr:Inhibitor of growth protein 3 [Blattella germanica]